MSNKIFTGYLKIFKVMIIRFIVLINLNAFKVQPNEI